MENSTSTTVVNSTISTTTTEFQTITFSWYDYGLFCGMLGASAMIGIYFGCFGSKQSTTGEYLLGGKTMKVIPVVISLVASHVSGITLLAVPADVYRYGSAYWLITFGLVFVCLVTSYVYLPVFFKLGITSTYEYLELRFDRRARQLASFLFALSLLLFLPIVIYVPALAFSAATGINLYIIAPIVCGVCIFYTTIGGLKAVVWTDTLQFTITVGAFTAVVFLGISSAGGFSVVWQKSLEGGRVDIFDMDPNPFQRDSFWIVFIGFTTHWISITATNQGCIQKFMSLPSLKASVQTVWLYAIGIAISKTISVLSGLIMYVKYADCDPLSTGEVKRKDQLLPYYVMDVAGKVPGLPGLFIAGVVCAALSTLSAHLNCLAGTIYEDFILKLMPKNTSEKTASNILKMMVVLTGVLCTSLVFIVERLGQILPLAIALGSITAGPVLGLFTLGVLFPKANAKGALWGTLIGLVIMMWLVFTAKYYEAIGVITHPTKPLSTAGCNQSLNASIALLAAHKSLTNGTNQKPFILFKVSHYYYTVMGTTITIILGLIISAFTRGKRDVAVRRELLSPVIYFLLPAEGIQLKADYNSVDQALKEVSTTEDDKETDVDDKK